MRRSDKEIADKAEIESILLKCNICRLGLLKNGKPHIIPVNYGYSENALYIHSSDKGEKIELIRSNNNVCFEIEYMPELVKAEIACDWTTRFKSIIGAGKIDIINDEKGKIKGLDILMKSNGYDKEATYKAGLLARMVILKLKIESLTAKKSGDW